MDSKDVVVCLLESYRERAKQIALLHYELEHLPRASVDEIIDAMSFGHGDGVPHSKGHISNKTLYIALNYHERTDKLNAESTSEIVDRLVALEHEQDKLSYYVLLLEERQRTVIQRFYFEAKSLERIAEELSVALRTVYKIKNRAISRLADMYRLCDDSLKDSEGQV